MKKSILFLLALFSVTMTTQAVDYYYKGNQTGWSAAAPMSVSSDGYYAYAEAKSYADNGNQNNHFKIALTADSWDYGADYLHGGFNGTDITNMGGWDSDGNCCIYHETSYYVLAYFPNTKINTTDKVKICASTFLPDDSETDLPEPEPVADVTIYFVNTKSWSSVNAYVWGTGDVSYKAWPGEAMTSTGDKAHGYDVYSYTFPETYTNCIFNGNGQTDDLTVNAGQYYDIASKTWYATLAEVPNPTPPVMETVYFINTGNWEKVYAYAWSSSNNGWPGTELTANGEKIGEFDIYPFEAEQDQWANIIFNNNSGTQTADLEWQAGKYYAHSTGEWYADAATAEAALAAVVTYDYYIAGTENLTGYNWKENGLGMTKEGDVYKHTFSELGAGIYEFKITNGTWTNPWGYSNLAANYVGVEQGKDGEGNPNGNIKFTTEEAKNITVIFDPVTGKITIGGLTEKAPAEDVTVYFINSGNWAEVACYYWGGLNASTWPGVKMDLTAETYEAEGWNVYKVTFPGDNTSCIFNDNKAEGATQTADLEVQNGKYYCYENGIWYERLADVDPLDTRVYLKGDMNEWCTTEGWCDMFRKETVDGTVAYRTVYLEEANTTYEFKIEDAGVWLSNTGTMTKDNCTGWTFEESVNDNAKITTEYVGEYTFVWDMTTKKLSVEYPELVPEVMDLMVTNMVFDGATTFSGTDNMMGIEFNLVVGSELEYGVYSLDASSTVNFGGTLFTDVTGMIAPDMNTFASATAQVFGFYMGMYFQLNVEMSAGGSAGVPVEILDGTASVNGAGELTISATWEGDDIYVMAPGFTGESYECDEVWFYVGGTDWETASIIAFGPATITVDGNDVLVEGTVMSGMTGTNYDLFVIGTLPAVEEPDYTRTVASGSYGTICLPNGSSKVEGAKFYEVTYKKGGYIYADEVTTLVAGMPYIFHATSTEIKVYYNETTAAAGSKNGVYGTFSDITDGDAGKSGNVLEGKYLLVAGPKVQKCGGNCSLAANRAYFVVSEISDVEQQSAPGRQRIALGCQEENQATGVDNITENGVVAPAMQGTYDILGRQLSEPAANGFYIINGKKMFVVK